MELGLCLRETFGWKRSCGYLMAPPSDVKVGDVLIYHSGSCGSASAHAVIVVEGGSNAKNCLLLINALWYFLGLHGW